jgi:hypothetical protein
MFSRLALISTSTRYSWPGLTPQSYHAGRYLGVRPRRSSSVSPVSEPKRQTRPYGGIGGLAFFTTRVIGATIAARAHLGRSCGYSECHLHRSSSDRPAGSHRAPGNPALFLLLPNKTPDWSSNWPFCAGPDNAPFLGHRGSTPRRRPQGGRFARYGPREAESTCWSAVTAESGGEPSPQVVCDRPFTHHVQALMRLLSAHRRPNRSMFAHLGKCPGVCLGGCNHDKMPSH